MDFSFISDPIERRYTEDVCQAVEKAGMWAWLRQLDTPGVCGFMFSTSPEMNSIVKHMSTLEEHSGSSFGWTMRRAQHIAMEGYDFFKKSVVEGKRD
jgi:hypothetical protein